MTWMNKSAGGFPLYLAKAKGAHVEDIDGHDLTDFCLGDTGAMAGHSPEATVRAVHVRYAELGGATAMMPSEDAEWVGAELARRFGLPYWSFSLTATDANRWAIRLARAVTGRPKILFHNYCYHGSVDESLIVVGPDGEGTSRAGNVGAPVDVTERSRVVEFNDLQGMERQLAHGDVAAVLMEPALTNIGIVLPADGYLAGVRELTRKHGSLLINDETHTFSAGPGGCTKSWNLRPDMLTIGKAIAGGIPTGAYGLSAELAEKITGRDDLDLIDVGGVSEGEVEDVRLSELHVSQACLLDPAPGFRQRVCGDVDRRESRLGAPLSQCHGLGTDTAPYLEHLAPAWICGVGVQQVHQRSGLVLQALVLTLVIAVHIRLAHGVPRTRR
jgi:glutamate-1-semialdehyde 2,1-aminomutase